MNPDNPQQAPASLLSKGLNSTRDAVLITEAGTETEDLRIVYYNQTFRELTGYSPDNILNRSPVLLFGSETDEELVLKLNEQLQKGNEFSEELVSYRKDKSSFHARWTVTPYREDGEIKNWIFIVNDLTKQEELENHLVEMAFYDSLTGLPNRSLFMERLDQELKHAKRADEKLAVIFMDLDCFKKINDTMGHKIGDDLLCAVGNELEEKLRESDSIARVGGDEFAIIATEVEATRDTREVVNKIFEIFSSPFQLEDNVVNITASMGVATYPEHGNEEQVLLTKADAAMYRAKEQSKNSHQFYKKEIRKRDSRDQELKRGLESAIENDELLLHYQPLFDLSEDKLVAAEALLRWQREDRGLIKPGEFIPLAEMSGQILEIDRWVLKKVCEQWNDWKENDLRTIPVAVNISIQDFRQSEFLNKIKETVSSQPFEADNLTIELSERVSMLDVEFTISRIKSFKNLGMNFCLDDFGTGQASVKYLQRFPIDFIKLGESVVERIPQDANACSLVRAIMKTAREIEVQVAAEGVEEEAQKEFLLGTNCHYMQGKLFKEPLPPEEFSSLLQK